MRPSLRPVPGGGGAGADGARGSAPEVRDFRRFEGLKLLDPIAA